MTSCEVLTLIAAQRRERCHLILSAPAEFKICNSCQSILFARSSVCPFCRGYGFESSVTAVVEMAQLLSQRPLALGCAVLPRQTTLKALAFA